MKRHIFTARFFLAASLTLHSPDKISAPSAFSTKCQCSQIFSRPQTSIRMLVLKIAFYILPFQYTYADIEYFLSACFSNIHAEYLRKVTCAFVSKTNVVDNFNRVETCPSKILLRSRLKVENIIS